MDDPFLAFSPVIEAGCSAPSLLRVRMRRTRRVRLAKAPGRTSSIRLLVRFTESSFGCVAKEPGWSFSAMGEGKGGLVDDNVTSIQAHL